MNFRWAHLEAMIRKEFYHILRDPGTLLLVSVGPLFLMLIFVFAMTSEVENVTVAVVDHAGSTRSEELIERLDASEVIHIAERLDGEDQIAGLMDRGEIRAAIVIPEGYGAFSIMNLMGGGIATPNIVIDGTEPTSAEKVLEEAYRVTEGHMRDIVSAVAEGVPGFDSALLEPPVRLETERRYNPDLRALVDFYPGLAAMVLSLPGIGLALAVARERELGTMEQLVATPVSKLGLLVGKLVPYMSFGMVNVVVLLMAGRVFYDVPFRGNVLEYLFVSFFFMFSNMGLGLLISVFFHSQQVAMIVAFLVFFVPGFFLSGIFFPVDAMPQIVQMEMQMLPVTHYVAVSQGMYLQGTPVAALWLNAVALAALSVGITALSVVLFRKKVA